MRLGERRRRPRAHRCPHLARDHDDDRIHVDDDRRVHDDVDHRVHHDDGSPPANDARAERAPPPPPPPTTTTPAPPPPPPPPTTAVAAAPAPSGDGSLAGKVIAIDPGHNGANGAHASEINQPVDIITKTITCDTTGTAAADGYSESAYNLDLARQLQQVLAARGATVVMTRTDNTGWGPCVNRRAAIGNDAHADAAISVHADGNTGAGARGFHVLEPAPIAGHNEAIVAPSARLGAAVRDAFATTGMPVSNYYGSNGIAVRNDLGGLNLSVVPKVFIESGNMRNSADLALLEDPAWRARAATALADALTRFLTTP